MEILELTVRCCLHLVRHNKGSDKPEGIASGVMVKYRERYFICTVAHFSLREEQDIYLLTGRIKDGQTEIRDLQEFSYVYKISFEDMPDAEDLEYCFANPDLSGTPLDIAFREVPLLENIWQGERNFHLEDYDLHVEQGPKAYAIIDSLSDVDTTQLCSFFGRIRPDYKDGILNFQEQLYYGLTIKGLSDDFVEMDLVAPVQDHRRFKGCSGAPVFDTRGQLLGLVTHGDKDLAKSSIFAYRIDRLKYWLELTYFQETPAAPAIK